jgi:hypothetical protein
MKMSMNTNNLSILFCQPSHPTKLLLSGNFVYDFGHPFVKINQKSKQYFFIVLSYNYSAVMEASFFLFLGGGDHHVLFGRLLSHLFHWLMNIFCFHHANLEDNLYVQRDRALTFRVKIVIIPCYV